MLIKLDRNRALLFLHPVVWDPRTNKRGARLPISLIKVVIVLTLLSNTENISPSEAPSPNNFIFSYEFVL